MTDARSYSTSQVFDSLEPSFIETPGGTDGPDLDDEVPDDLEPEEEPGIMGDDDSADDGRDDPWAR